MTPGTILLDAEFEFSDGTKGEKYIVVLNDGGCGWYVAVKTTSQERRYTYTPGCQLGYLACFHLPQGWCWFPRDTWVQLEEFFEFSQEKLLQESQEGRFMAKGVLPNGLRSDLIQYALQTEDISGRHAEEISKFQ